MITDQKSNAKIIGVYVVGDLNSANIQLAVPIKPNWLRKFFTWLFLGWKYYTIEELKKHKEKLKSNQ